MSVIKIEYEIISVYIYTPYSNHLFSYIMLLRNIKFYQLNIIIT